MSKSVVLRSFAELAEHFAIDELPAAPPAADGAVAEGAVFTLSETAAESDAGPLERDAGPLDLGALLAELAQAGATLAGLAQQDQDARCAARGLLERYEALGTELGEAEAACGQAQQVRAAAEQLAATAFAETARAAAQGLLAVAARAEEAAGRLVDARRAARDDLAAEPALARLLDERREEQARKDAEAAAAEQARRLGEGLAAARAALAAGCLREAQATLGELAKDHPDSADLASVQFMIRQRFAAVKIDAAEEALREARRCYRGAPTEAIGRLERVDLQDLPEHLLQQLKGVWAAACARVCKERRAEAFLRYLPQPAYGVVIAREAAGEYRVVSALGPSHLQAGAAVDEAFVRRAQPLRASGR